MIDSEMTEQETLFNTIGEELGEKSQMFGKHCYKVNKKAFVCFFQNAMVFKLTDKVHKEALSLEGSQLFDPSGKGRAMKEWVQLPFDYKEQWKGFAEKALDYVAGK